MRAPEDMPRPTRRSMGRGRVIIIVVIVAALLLLTSARELSNIYTDYLWYDSVNLNNVWRTVVLTKFGLGAVFTVLFFVLLYVNLVIADRIAPKFRPLGPEDELLSRYQMAIERRAGWLRVGVAAAFAIIFGAGESSEWQEWLLFSRGGDFGQSDATFGQDVGFYMFKLPFITTVLSWLVASLIAVLLITLVAHYLNGGIRLQVAHERVTPQVKRHISVLLALIALVKLVGYFYERYELVFSTRGAVDGATYTETNAVLGAIYVLMFASFVALVCLLWNIRRQGWVLPIIAIGLWAVVAVIGGEVVPALVQKFIVQPAESEKERPYIEHNIAATRQSMALDKVESRQFNWTPDIEATKSGAQANPGTVRNIQLLDTKVVQPAYQQLQGLFNFYRFTDLDVDRYPIRIPDGSVAKTSVVIGGRDLSEDIPSPTWENRRISYTHGYGVALAAASATTTNGSPDFIVGDVPVQIQNDKAPELSLPTPDLYFGERMPGYAIVGTSRDEVAYLDKNGQTVEQRYKGKGGVPIDSFIKRLAFSQRFGENDILFSGFIKDDSRIIYLRDVRDRVKYAAPFLQWDADPYPVISSEGRVVYMIDGYTTSPYYPNAQQFDTLRTGETPNPPSDAASLFLTRFNYVRNSVKATVDAYDGTIKLYIWDPSDPVINAYKDAFPGLFTDKALMLGQLQDHVRYPEDLFRVQTSMYGRYHLSDPLAFYQRSGAWSLAVEPPSKVPTQGSQAAQRAASNDKVTPLYQVMRLPKETDDSFVAFRTFVPYSASGDSISSQKLQSFMVAKSDPDSYGKLVVYEMPNPPAVDGPNLVDSRINNEPNISRDISLFNQQGSELQFGQMLLIPFGEGDKGTIIYVRPLYVKSQNRPVPELKKVIVTTGENGDNRIVMRDTLQQALRDLLGAQNVTTFEGAPDRSPGGSPESTTTTTAPPGGSTSSTSSTSVPPSTTPPSTTAPTSGDVPRLIDDANKLLDEANAALRAGDLATYQAKVNQAQEKIRQANALIAQSTTTTTTAPPATPSA